MAAAESLGVGRVVILLAGLVFAGEIEELGAIQSDAAGAARDGGDAHGAGNDGGMAGAPADVGGKTLNVQLVEGGRLTGKHVVGDDDDVTGQMREILALLADEMAKEPLFDVVDVFDALGEVAV